MCADSSCLDASRVDSSCVESPLRLRAVAALAIPLVFFAARGAFSFQSDGDATGGFSPGTVAMRDPGLLGSVILPGLVYGCTLWLIHSRWRDVLRMAMRFRLFTLLALMTVASAAWSQQPAHSLVFGCCYLIDTLFAFYLVCRFEPDELMQVLEWLLLLLCVTSVVMVVAFPQYGRSQLDVRNPGAWAGIFSSRGSASRAYLYLITASVMLWHKQRTLRRTLMFLLAMLMVMNAHVVTTMLMLALFVTYLCIQRFTHTLARRTSFAVLLTLIVGTAAGAALLYPVLPALLQAVGRDPTLTGRTDIWAVLIQSVMKRPLLGYGFYAFWQGLKGESGVVIHRLNWTFGYAHNGYLEISLQLGLIGLVLFLVTLAMAIRNAWICARLDRTGRYDWFIGIILLTVVQNLDDCTVLWPKDLLSILYIVACCAVALGAWQLRRQPQLQETAYA